MFRIIALDPGGTTGWAAYTAERMEAEKGKYEYYAEKFTCGQIDAQEHHLQLYNMLGLMQTQVYHVVTESFEYRNRARPGLELISREYIGVTKLFCADRQVTFHKQTAAMGKGFVKDENIKKLGLWSPGFKHAMDAYRHLLYYMINDANVQKEKYLKLGWR